MTSSKISRMPCLSQIVAQALEVALRRHQHAGRSGQRLDDHRRDGVAVQRHHPFQVVGQMRAPGGLAAREGVVLQAVCVRQVIDIRQQRAELLAVAADAADRHAAEADAVIAALAPDQPHALAFAAGALIGERDLQRGVGALGAGVGEEDAVEAGRRVFGNLRRRLERDRVAELEGRREIHHRRLLLDRLSDLGPPVPGIDAPEAGGAVDHGAPVAREVVHAFGAREQPRRGLVGPVAGERHPEGIEVVRARGDLVHGVLGGGCTGELRRAG